MFPNVSDLEQSNWVVKLGCPPEMAEEDTSNDIGLWQPRSSLIKLKWELEGDFLHSIPTFPHEKLRRYSIFLTFPLHIKNKPTYLLIS